MFKVSESGYTATTVIIGGNPGGFKIEITGGKRPEAYTSREEFTMELLSGNDGIKAFIEAYRPGLYTPWFNKAMSVARELKREHFLQSVGAK